MLKLNSFLGIAEIELSATRFFKNNYRCRFWEKSTSSLHIHEKCFLQGKEVKTWFCSVCRNVFLVLKRCTNLDTTATASISCETYISNCVCWCVIKLSFCRAWPMFGFIEQGKAQAGICVPSKYLSEGSLVRYHKLNLSVLPNSFCSPCSTKTLIKHESELMSKTSLFSSCLRMFPYRYSIWTKPSILSKKLEI